MTNADRIRNMSNEELALSIDDSRKYFSCDECSIGNKRGSKCSEEENCVQYVKQWLESETD